MHKILVVYFITFLFLSAHIPSTAFAEDPWPQKPTIPPLHEKEHYDTEHKYIKSDDKDSQPNETKSNKDENKFIQQDYKTDIESEKTNKEQMTK